MKLITLFLKILIRAYQLLISPFLAGTCRFQPTCSQYAINGLEKNGIKAIPLILKRIARCHPFGGNGFDPYPSKNKDQ